jgi:carboxypeptidase Taq
MKELEQLRARLAEIRHIRAAAGVLGWDQSTYLPPGARAARGRHMSTLSRIAHEKATDPAVGRLLDACEKWAEGQPPDSDDVALLRVCRRDYDRATRVPSEFVARWAALRSESFGAWAKARPENDVAAVLPYLERMIDMSRAYSAFFPEAEHVADPHIALSDYGMTAATIRDVFARLRAELVPLVKAIAARPPADDACLRQPFSRKGQEAFFTQVIRDFGYDYNRGRHDVAPHPFTTSFSVTDVRITVRYRDNYLGDAIFSAFHEAGHALYQQGINPAYEDTPLCHGTSSGAHESQSRLWENVVGRSLGFWSHYYPKLQAIFPDELKGVSLDTFYRAVNKVKPSLIRTDADEVTYNLHPMLRFDLELAMLEGNLAAKDLPDAWNARYESDLGILPPDHRDGVLQDMHWYSGRVGGAFQGYTLGNILSAQFYNAALRAHPEIPSETESGRFGTLHAWLKDNIYQHGGKYDTAELVELVTGGPLRIEPYVAYLKAKYGALYNL